jgi:response regulator of citrate/malate metabolism
MMAPIRTANKPQAQALPRVLVVEDEPALVELVRDIVGPQIECQLLFAGDIHQAKSIIANQAVDLLVTDLHLPDGDGMTLLSSLREKIPAAGAIVITGKPSVSAAVTALRAGAADFLPKPFSVSHLVERVNKALERQKLAAKTEKRLDRLRDAVRRLNLSRRMVSKKVDLLCNDLVSAYGDLAKRFDAVRHQEAFRKLLAEAKDLEQMLCHAMDWLLRHSGYCNVAVWLASESDGFQLGAYMKYTIPGEPALTDAMRNGIVPMTVRENLVHLAARQADQKLTSAELDQLGGQTILATNCAYLGESLAVVVMFRDDKSPFTEEDVEMLRAISSTFATALAAIVHGNDGALDDEGGNLLEEEDGDGKGPKGKNPDNADWWKRGEPPPF